MGIKSYRIFSFSSQDVGPLHIFSELKRKTAVSTYNDPI